MIRQRAITDSAPAKQAGSGSRKIGRFTIVQELGQGGFGIVYLAVDPLLGRLVALKLPRLQIFESPELTRRFVLEAQAAARLDHPNVVSIYDVGELGPEPGCGFYIASAYCSEGSLAAWIARQSVPVAPRQAAELLIKLAEGVQHLHDHGILHRDLKPSNVLLQRSGSPQSALAATGAGNEDLARLVPRIGDFGLARFQQGSADQTLSGHPIGSPSYMSPEQAEGRLSALGPATDVYGLGGILYCLLAGRAPFRGENPSDTVRHVIQDEPVPLRRLRPAVPRDLETICLTCLQKAPSRRYLSAAVLRDDLNRWLEGKPIHCAACLLVRAGAQVGPPPAGDRGTQRVFARLPDIGPGWHSLAMGACRGSSGDTYSAIRRSCAGRLTRCP